MDKKEIIDIFVEGKPVTFGDKKTEKPWKDTIIKSFNGIDINSIEKSKVMLEFLLTPDRFMRKGKQPRNDLDNLSKPVLDALVELGIFPDDSGVLDLILRKRKSNVQGVKIQIAVFDDNEFI